VKKFLLACLSLCFTAALAAQSPLYFPPKIGTTWQTTDPSTLGFCPDRIDSLYNFLEVHNSKSFILLKDGKIVLEKYFGTFTQDSFWYYASAGKSVTAFLVGQAQESGILRIDSSTSKYLGNGWTSCPPDKEKLITVRHQLTMTSGLDDTPPLPPGVTDPNNCTQPACMVYKADAGTRWAYHTAAYRLLHNVLENASGMTINAYTKTTLLDRTGMKGAWVNDVFYGRARDMARYGLLIAAHGVWATDTLMHDQQYFNAMVHSSQNLNKSYGYLWWLNGQGSFMLPGLQIVVHANLIPNAPLDMFAALGKNDQKIHVAPSKGWVVIRQGNAAGYTGATGQEVPVQFDNDLWGYLNQLVCTPTATGEVVAGTVSVSPNPAGADGWTITTGQAPDRVILYDAMGRGVYDQTPEYNGNTLQLRSQNLQSGVYFAALHFNGVVSVVRLCRI
jgi:CubicO group peptidase (beta-lactamase class C family)